MWSLSGPTHPPPVFTRCRLSVRYRVYDGLVVKVWLSCNISLIPRNPAALVFCSLEEKSSLSDVVHKSYTNKKYILYL